MANSPRLNVLIELTNLLKTITPANGYIHDLSTSVFRGRDRFGDESPETMVSILEAPRPDPGREVGTLDRARHERWSLLLQGWCPDDTANPTDPVYELMEDVERCLRQITAEMPNGRPVFPAIYLLGNRITSFSFGPGVVRPPTETISAKAFFYLPVQIGLASRTA